MVHANSVGARGIWDAAEYRLASGEHAGGGGVHQCDR